MQTHIAKNEWQCLLQCKLRRTPYFAFYIMWFQNIAMVFTRRFLRAKAATALARLSRRNAVCLSVRHTGGSVKNGAS